MAAADDSSEPSERFSVMKTYGATLHAPIRWGLLGTGKIAEDFANALYPCKDIVLQAIGSRSIESANTFADLFKIPNRHGSYESLVSDPSVDVIWIGTPDAYHAQHAMLALNAGKPVLVEKPFCATAAEAEAVYALSKEKKLFCMEGIWTRFVPSMERTLEYVSSGALGKISLVHSDFGCPFPIPAGALNALGVYNLALAHMVFDLQSTSSDTSSVVQPSKLHATGTMREDGQADTQVAAILQFGKSQIATFTASLLVDSHKEAFIVGENGRIRLLGPLWHSTQSIVVELNGKLAQEIKCDSLEDVVFPRAFNLLNSERLIFEALEVNRCLRSKLIESPGWTHGQSLQVMKEMEEIRKQIRE